MAGLKMNVEFPTRLCEVKGELGYFHLWEQWSNVVDASLLRGGHPAGQIGQVYGIVEFKDGVRRVDPVSIKFCDEENAILCEMAKHHIAAKEFTLDDFSHEHLVDDLDVRIEIGGTDHRDTGPMEVLGMTIDVLNHYREKYLAATKTEEYTGLPAKDIWWQMIQLLPSSYNQKRTVMLNYEVLANIYKSRRHHKLDEWHTLCDRIESLPYSALITGTAV